MEFILTSEEKQLAMPGIRTAGWRMHVISGMPRFPLHEGKFLLQLYDKVLHLPGNISH